MTREEILAIKVRIVDTQAIGRITPEGLNRYLLAHGWLEGEAEALVTVWVLDNPMTTILVPSLAARDYGLRVVDVLMTLSHREHRSQLAVYVDILEGQ